MIKVGLLANPLDPHEMELHEVSDLRAFLVERFASWPETARIYNMEGFGELDRASLAAGSQLLASRDVTPPGEEGPQHDKAVERLGELRGPILVAVAPADPITAIIVIVAVVVAVAASLLLMPHPPDAAGQTYQSPNNALSDRSNTARPGSRIPDIFGTVRSTPDLLAVPYKKFIDNLEVELAYMCVGRGAYDLSDVRDGATVLENIAGAGASFYAPFTSPMSGDDPQLRIGSPIPEPVLSTIRMNDVNGQVLRAPNANFVQGSSNIRFVAPDRIERSGGDVDFTEFFDTDDVLTVAGADFGSTVEYVYYTGAVRFYPDMRVEFQALDPRTKFVVGEVITLTNAGYAGVDGTGATLYVDLSGTYTIASMTSTIMQLA